MFQVSQGLFWQILPVAFLLAILLIYAKGEISGGRLESLFRRLLVAIALLVAFPQISSAATGLETYLVSAFGGDAPILKIFGHVADRAKEIEGASTSSWLKLGQIGLTIIATLSFLVLSVVRHFLDVLHLTTWNLLHILGPLALLGCLFDSWQQVPKGIFAGMLELSLWKPIWVILSRILIAIGFGESPPDPSQWFDTAVMNFAVAGLMAGTPMIAHGLLSGTLASVGSSTLQTGLAGVGAFLTAVPMRALQSTINAGGAGLKAAGGAALRPMISKPSGPPNGPMKPKPGGGSSSSPRTSPTSSPAAQRSGSAPHGSSTRTSVSPKSSSPGPHKGN